MGNSGELPNKNIDATVGGLVWVRRRNGSWWPGKILGPEELPEGCVPTPRSGTPVKLLGRENARVDWYNLEKSKRVKAFHCGEYDECIKKVKESASKLSKKAAKYAEREDAILHALELERTRLVQNQPDLSAIPVAQNGEHDHVSESPPSEEVDEDPNSSADDSANKVSESDHDDGYEGVKRMRGLEDLGMGVVASSVKKKRSQVTHVALLKRKNRHRHRPLTKVMASATMVSVPVESEIKVSGSESSESYEKGTLLLSARRQASDDASPECQQKDDENGPLQKLFDVPLVAEEQHSADASQMTHACARAHSSQGSRVEAVSLVNEEHNGSCPTSSGAANIHDIGQSVERGSCEWRFKGKRNSRMRKVGNEAETRVTGVDHSQSLVSDNGGSHVKSRPGAAVQEFHGWGRNAHTQGPTTEQAVAPRLLPYRQSRFVVNPKYDDSDFPLRHHTAVSSLYDVSIEVKTGHRPQHVPYISLMSKLTGRPIIGHPLTVDIEVLDDSISEFYTSSSELDYSRQRLGSSRPQISQSQSKSPKSRRNTPPSKKTRKLSSLTGSHRLSREEIKKPLMEKLKGPSIACVPLKIVFSRINAALSSSIRAAPRLNATSIQ